MPSVLTARKSAWQWKTTRLSSQRHRKSLKAYTAKQDEILNTYMNEYMGAKLKDIGHEDTAIGREIVKSLIANNNDDRWWYSDYNYIDHGKKG